MSMTRLPATGRPPLACDTDRRDRADPSRQGRADRQGRHAGSRSTLLLLGLIGGIGASGCAGPAPEPQPPAAPPVVTAFDGRYAGTMRITGAAGGMRQSDCGTPPRVSLEVRNGQFTLPVPHPAVEATAPTLRGHTTPVYMAKIGPDGRVTGISPESGATMEGRVSGTRMTGQIYGLLCYYEFTADRI